MTSDIAAHIRGQANTDKDKSTRWAYANTSKNIYDKLSKHTKEDEDKESTKTSQQDVFS